MAGSDKSVMKFTAFLRCMGGDLSAAVVDSQKPKSQSVKTSEGTKNVAKITLE